MKGSYIICYPGVIKRPIIGLICYYPNNLRNFLSVTYCFFIMLSLAYERRVEGSERSLINAF